MLKLVRPEKPGDFQSKADIETEKLEVQIAGAPDKLTFNDAFWGKYKKHFVKAQNRKCGYCELRMSSYGDVEHYRPKSVVDDLESEGSEREDLMNVSGRKFKKSCKYGYWWLAYDWDNYLLSCTLCNQPWKRALFPLQGGRPVNEEPDSEYPHRSPEKGDAETALLLNPFNDVNLSDHISFNEIGLIEAFQNSEFGRETIRTCGLDRPSLFQARSSIAKTADMAIKAFSSSQNIEEARNWGKIILSLGNENSDFPGMVRIIFLSKSGGSTWEELENFVNQV